MRTIPNWRAAYRIGMLEEFTNSSESFYGANLFGVYKVWSYSTLIAEYYDGVWYLNDTTYSHTTTRHQGIVRRALPWRTITDESIHFYNISMYTTTFSDKIKLGSVMASRLARIKANA